MNIKYLKFGLLILILSLGLYVRYHHIGNYGLFIDEKMTSMIAFAKVNIGGMQDLMHPSHYFTNQDFWAPRSITQFFDALLRGDVSGNSLSYYTIVHYFTKVFGYSDASLRFPSLLFSFLTVLFAVYFSRSFHRKFEYLLLVAILASFEPFLVIFSQMGRNYTFSILMVFLNNYFFYKILVEKKYLENSKFPFLLWAITGLIGFFSTYLTALNLILQAIFAIYKRLPVMAWKKLIWPVILILLPAGLWMSLGPGSNFIQYQKEAADLYQNYLETVGAIPGWIEPPHFDVLSKRTIGILSDYFFLTNNLYSQFGYKIGLVLLLAFFYFVYRCFFFFQEKEKLFFQFSLFQLGFAVIFLVSSAIFAGSTAGFFIRYISFFIPQIILLCASLLWVVWRKNKPFFKFLAILWLGIQLNTAIQIIEKLHQDRQNKYVFSHDRESNPYIKAAGILNKIYVAGDTILHPSNPEKFLGRDNIDSVNFNINDAQWLNLYLDKNKTFIQRLNTLNRDSIILKKSNGKELVIFDFKGTQYRY